MNNQEKEYNPFVSKIYLYYHKIFKFSDDSPLCHDEYKDQYYIIKDEYIYYFYEDGSIIVSPVNKKTSDFIMYIYWGIFVNVPMKTISYTSTNMKQYNEFALKKFYKIYEDKFQKEDKNLIGKIIDKTKQIISDIEEGTKNIIATINNKPKIYKLRTTEMYNITSGV
jgi:hypothetical protein